MREASPSSHVETQRSAAEPMQIRSLSPRMRLHAIVELLHRAGVSAEDIATCEVNVNSERTRLRLGWDATKTIEFPVFAANVSSGRTSRLQWMFPPEPHTLVSVPDFVVPHCPAPIPDGPLFEREGADRVRCKADLPLIAFAVLNRWEEVQSSERDHFGRFTAGMSTAFKEGFLERPIVDEYGLALEQALRALSPGWKPVQRRARLKLSHDIDQVGFPFTLPSAGSSILHRKPLDALRALVAVNPRIEPQKVKTVDGIVQLSLDRGLDSAVYWMSTRPSRYDPGYSLRDPRIQKRAAKFVELGVEMGIHPGFHTFKNEQRLAEEVAQWRSALGTQAIGGRQHYLRWLPETWDHWESAGLSYDSSVGFAESIGFRSGTCVPFRPWSHGEDRALNLLEIPLLVMDVTLTGYMRLGKEEAVARVRALGERCKLAGGVFTLLCHNHKIAEADFGEEFYLRLVEATELKEKFDWRTELQTLSTMKYPAMHMGADR
jgi:hypothetical protein